MARYARLHCLLLIALFFLLPLSHAQQTPATNQSEQPAPWKFGAEVDLLPYINGGYYGSGFLSRGGCARSAPAPRRRVFWSAADSKRNAPMPAP